MKKILYSVLLTLLFLGCSVSQPEIVKYPFQIPTSFSKGVFLNGMSFDTAKIAVGNLQPTWIRYTYNLQGAYYQLVQLRYWKSQGYKLFVTVVNDSSGNFPKNIPIYKAQLTAFLQQFRPDFIAVENEELTANFHPDTISYYYPELRTAVSVCKQFRDSVTDGGLGYQEVKRIVYNLKISPAGRPRWQEVINTIDTIYALGIRPNVHYYTDTTVNDFGAYARFFGNIVTNEIGQTDTSSATVTALLDSCKPYVSNICWYATQGTNANNAYPLVNIDGTLTNSGNTFRKFK